VRLGDKGVWGRVHGWVLGKIAFNIPEDDSTPYSTLFINLTEINLAFLEISGLLEIFAPGSEGKMAPQK
jgi:hypothetical protein